jgi:hypothetical protein
MYNYTWRIPLLLSPLASSPLPSPLFPFVPLSLTWNPPSCDRIRPPRSQVACKLTPFDPPSPQPSPFQIPRTPNTPRLTTTTSGTTRHLLSGTALFSFMIKKNPEKFNIFYFCFQYLTIMHNFRLFVDRKHSILLSKKFICRALYCAILVPRLSPVGIVREFSEETKTIR